MSNAGQTQRDEQFSGFRAAINHVAAWSTRWVDLDAMLNDHVMMELAEREAAMIGATAAEAHQEVSHESLKRLRLRPMGPGIHAIESGGFRNPSWCEYLLSLADELHLALVQIARFRNWDAAERLAVKTANIKWPLVRQESDAELSWLAANPTSSPGEVVEPKQPAGDVTVPDGVALEPAMSAERPIKHKATDPDWSIPRSKGDWLRILKQLGVAISGRTLRRYLDGGIYRQYPGTKRAAKTIKLDKGTLPEDYSDTMIVGIMPASRHKTDTK